MRRPLLRPSLLVRQLGSAPILLGLAHETTDQGGGKRRSVTVLYHIDTLRNDMRVK